MDAIAPDTVVLALAVALALLGLSTPSRADAAADELDRWSPTADRLGAEVGRASGR